MSESTQMGNLLSNKTDLSRSDIEIGYNSKVQSHLLVLSLVLEAPAFQSSWNC
jgi:hypothetical protein